MLYAISAQFGPVNINSSHHQVLWRYYWTDIWRPVYHFVPAFVGVIIFLFVYGTRCGHLLLALRSGDYFLDSTWDISRRPFSLWTLLSNKDILHRFSNYFGLSPYLDPCTGYYIMEYTRTGLNPHHL